MIAIETLPDGFVLTVDGRKILTHTRRSPCLELGSGENFVKQSKGRFSIRSRHTHFSHLKSFKIVECSDDFVVIEFEGRLSMAVRERDRRIKLSFSRYDASINRFRLRIVARPDERLFGCGERFSRLDLKRRTIDLWVRERGPGSGLGLASVSARRHGSGGGMDASAKELPAYVSTDGYWCIVDAVSYSVFEFHRASTIIESWSVPREILIGYEADSTRSTAAMNSHIGKAPLPPEWIFDGAWLGVSGGLVSLAGSLATVKEAGAAIGAVWVPDWCGIPSTSGRPRAASEWKADSSLYPQLAQEIASLRAKGIRFVGRIDPYLSPEGELGLEASERGFLVKNKDGDDYLLPAHITPVVMVDLTNTDAFAWIKSRITQSLIDIGMSAWAADGGELLPADAVLASGESGMEAHNRWSVLWARANREAIEESGRASELAFFVRSAWLGSARYATSFVCGEQLSTLEGELGLQGAICSALSSSFWGAVPWHCEVGGGSEACVGRLDPECLSRWMEMAAFTPLFRTSADREKSARSGKLRGARLWSDQTALTVFARMSQTYRTLKPYHLAVAEEAAELGLPYLRHPWLHYPDDRRVLQLSGQFLYGRDLMIAPNLSRGTVLTELYLPEDEWIHLWTSRCFRGGEVSIESPLGYPAVFYRAASPFARLFDEMRRTGRRS
jgi:alpha-glucosidase